MPAVLQSLFFSRLYVFHKGRLSEFTVEAARLFKEFIIVRLGGIDTISQAEELIGSDVLVPDQDLKPLGEDEIYFHEIEGFTVVALDGKTVGKIKDMLATPGNDLLVVAASDREVLIPFVKSICVRLDRERKQVVIDPPEGLLELDEI